MNKLYIIGSLRNPLIPLTSHCLRSQLPGVEIFDDWYAAGPEADDYWMTYEKARGRTYAEALAGYAARNVYAFDKSHLLSADGALLILPAGKSGHLELGFMAGLGKWTGILLPQEEPERWDVMYQFAGKVYRNVDEVVEDVAVATVSKERSK
jgi:hypothetical protein